MSDITDDAPTVTNDSGTGRDGTRLDETWYDSFLTAINNQVLSSTNPTVTPADTIDEVVTARGSVSDLDGRISVEHNADGTHKSTFTSTFVTESVLMGGLGGVNLLRNDDFQVWPDGDTSAPLYWTLTGTGATIARTGTGLADTGRKVGDFAVEVTRVGNNAYLKNVMLDGTAFTRADFLKGKYLAIGCWVKCSAANRARIRAYDGASGFVSEYHTGGGTWEFLPATRLIDSSATEISMFCEVLASDGEAHFSGATAILLDSDYDLTQYQPAPTVIYGAMHFAIGGALSVGAGQGQFIPARGGIVKDVQVAVSVAPVGADLIFDVNTYDGASNTSMFSAGARPTIADGTSLASSQPDDTYARRCLRGVSGASLSAGGYVTLDVDQIGSGTAGSNAIVEVRALQYATPLERFLNYDG